MDRIEYLIYPVSDLTCLVCTVQIKVVSPFIVDSLIQRAGKGRLWQKSVMVMVRVQYCLVKEVFGFKQRTLHIFYRLFAAAMCHDAAFWLPALPGSGSRTSESTDCVMGLGLSRLCLTFSI